MSNDTQTAIEREIAALETAVAKARDDDDPTRLITALINLGQTHLNHGNAPKALTQFEEGLELAEANEEQSLAARLWGYKGICLMRLGNSHFAQIALYKSYNLAKELDSAPVQIDALTHLGVLQMDAEEPTKAISKLEKAMGIALSANDKPRLTYLAGKLGGVFLGLSSLEKAVEYYALALKTAEEQQKWDAACSYKLGIAQAHLANEQPDSARELFEEALTLAGDIENTQAEMSALSGLMRVAIAKDNSSMVSLYGEHVLRLAQQNQANTFELNNLNLLTAYLLEKQQFKKALPHLKRGRALAESMENWQWQLTMQERLGFAHYQLSQLPEALIGYRAAQKTAMQLQDPKAAAQLYDRISAVLADQGQPDEAVEAAEKALTLAEEEEDLMLVGEGHMLLAFTYADLEKLPQALHHCRQAIAAYREAGAPDLLSNAEALQAELAQLTAVPTA